MLRDEGRRCTGCDVDLVLRLHTLRSDGHRDAGVTSVVASAQDDASQALAVGTPAVPQLEGTKRSQVRT